MEIPRHWRLKAQRYRLEGSACVTCGQRTFPPRAVCPHCMAHPSQMAGEIFPISQTSTMLTNIEAQIRYQITERMTG